MSQEASPLCANDGQEFEELLTDDEILIVVLRDKEACKAFTAAWLSVPSVFLEASFYGIHFCLIDARGISHESKECEL